MGKNIYEQKHIEKLAKEKPGTKLLKWKIERGRNLYECGCGNKRLVTSTEVFKSDCSDCGYKNRTKEQKLENNSKTIEFIVKIAKTNKGVKLVGELNFLDKNHDFICSCGRPWKTTPRRVVMGVKCKMCQSETGTHKKSEATYKKELKDKEIEVKLIGFYIGHEDKTSHLCTCGETWDAKPKSVLNGGKCSKCKIYNRAQKELFDVLNTNIPSLDLNYEISHKDIGAMRFDYYSHKHNLAIERDGRQHYEPVSFFGGEKQFKKTIEKDNLKDLLCLEAGIKLIRIPYWLSDDEAVELVRKSM